MSNRPFGYFASVRDYLISLRLLSPVSKQILPALVLISFCPKAQADAHAPDNAAEPQSEVVTAPTPNGSEQFDKRDTGTVGDLYPSGGPGSISVRTLEAPDGEHIDVQLAGESGLGLVDFAGERIEDATKAGLTDADVAEIYELHAIADQRLEETRENLRGTILEEIRERVRVENARRMRFGKEKLAFTEERLTQEQLDGLVETRLAENSSKDLYGWEEQGGRVELNSLKSDDGKRTFIVKRVVHERSGVSFLFSDQAGFLRSLKHYSQKYAARQEHAAQRHFGLVDSQTGQIVDFRRLNESVFAFEHWRTYMQAIATATSGKDKSFGAVFTLAELAMMFAIFEWPASQLYGTEISVGSLMVKAAFGTVMGVWLVRTYQSWIDHKPRTRPEALHQKITVAKRSALSVLFGLAILGAENGIGAFSVTNGAIFVTIGAMLGNMFISNYVKDEALERISIRSRLGFYRAETSKDDIAELIGIEPREEAVSFKDKMKKFVGESQKVAEGQGLRTITGFLRYVDLALTGGILVAGSYLAENYVTFVPEMVVQGGTYLGSRAAYLSLIGIPLYLNYRYVSKLLTNAELAYQINPTVENRTALQNIRAEAEKNKERGRNAVKFVKALPAKVFMSPVTLAKKIAEYVRLPSRTVINPVPAYATAGAAPNSMNLPTEEPSQQHLDVDNERREHHQRVDRAHIMPERPAFEIGASCPVLFKS